MMKGKKSRKKHKKTKCIGCSKVVEISDRNVLQPHLNGGGVKCPLSGCQIPRIDRS